MNFRSIACLTGAAALLSACMITKEAELVSGVETWTPNTWDCLVSQDEVAKKATWDEPTTVTEIIQDNIYQSGLLSFKVGKPYVIKFTNNDQVVRFLRAPIFFSKSSILKVVHEGEDIKPSCLQAIGVAPKQTTEIHLVPLETGYFDYHDTFMTAPILTEISTNGSVGLAYVY